jgi:arylsulfatase A-like enzyme/Flp pilus assembly protein TadD
VLLVTIDTLRADALGVYGHPTAQTPWIDRLARGGVRFASAHAHNVETLPSHCNILSGRYPYEHGVRDNYGFRFPPALPTLATILKERGYATGAFVSAFPLAARFGLGRGFDLYDDRFLYAGTGRSSQERKGIDTVRAAVEFLEESRRRGPVFVWVHLYEPHYPYEPPEPFASRFRDDPYHGEVSAADAALEPLLQPVLAAGKEGRTLVVFTADHGESLGEHGEKTHGILAYEGPLRVPLILYCPRLFGPAVVEEGGRHVDILPTIMDALTIPRGDDLPGRSLLGAPPRPAPPSYFEALSGMVNRRWAPLYGVLQGHLKYIDVPIPELYDLSKDPKEEENLIATGGEALESLKASLARFRAKDPGPHPQSENAETRERLRSLGYVGGTDLPQKARYGPEDDPKRLMALDHDLEEVTALERRGDVKGALARCQAVLERRPGMPLVLLQLASLEQELGNLNAAIAAAKQALALGPGDPQTAAALGDYLVQGGRPKEAIALLTPFAAQVDPHPEVLVGLGTALAEVGQLVDALHVLGDAQKRSPSDPMVLVNIGTVYLMGRDYPKAQRAFEAALALNPQVARAHNSLGVVLAETGRPEEAVREWKQAVALDSRDLDTVFNLGALLRRLGRPAEARPYLERFMREAPPEQYGRDRSRVAAWLAQGP